MDSKDLSDFRFESLERTSKEVQTDIQTIKTDLVKTQKDLSVVSRDLSKIIGLLWTVLGAFVTSFAIALWKLVQKAGGSL